MAPAAFFALVGGAAACSSEPAYLGVGGGASNGGSVDAPEPLTCEEDCFVDPGLNWNEVRTSLDPSTFPEVTPAGPAPSWVYPLEGSVHPNNLSLLSLHFERATNEEEVFELSVGEGERNHRIYFPCLSVSGNGCTYKVPEDFWTEIASEFSGETVNLSLRGGRPGTSSAVASRAISFSPDNVRGGLYYWSSELRGMYRLLFGARQAVPYVSPGTPENPGACAGCHAISRDGSTIAYTLGSADPDEDVFQNAAFDGSLRVAPVTALKEATIDPTDATPIDSGMISLSREGDRVVLGFDFRLELRDTQTGALLDELLETDGKSPFFPEFSPDDRALVVTLSDSSDTEIAVLGGGLFIVSLEGDSFGELTELVPQTPELSHYYPSWSPDGKWVAFVSSPAGIKSYDQAQGSLQIVSVDTGEIFSLKGASGPANSTSTWPKFAPFSQCPGATPFCPGEEIFFLSYSSKRTYGLVSNQPESVIRSQLWMSALYMGRAREGQDPSSPPFWVPYQAADTSNHLGYWTSAVRCNSTYGCGADQLCDITGECILRPR